jgi:DNA-binding MarR family transcriptional regulator
MAIDQTRAGFAQSTAASGADARLFLREEELDRAADLILASAKAFFRAAEQPLSRWSLGPAHYRALAAIRREPNLTVSVLMTRLGVRKQSLARVLNELEKAALIVRAPSPADRRARLLTLTEAGITAEREASAALRERLAQVFRATGADAVLGARSVLTALIQGEDPR